MWHPACAAVGIISVDEYRPGIQIASDLVPSADIVGDDEQDTILLRKVSEDAK